MKEKGDELRKLNPLDEKRLEVMQQILNGKTGIPNPKNVIKLNIMEDSRNLL